MFRNKYDLTNAEWFEKWSQCVRYLKTIINILHTTLLKEGTFL